MLPRPLSIFLVVAVVAFSAVAESASDEQYAAAAHMHIWVFAAEGLQSKCSRQFPEIRERIGKDLARWELQDRVAIKRANALWKEMEAASPRSREEVQADAAQLEALWSSLLQSDSPKEKCLSYFEDHTRGVLRERWPEVYEALEGR